MKKHLYKYFEPIIIEEILSKYDESWRFFHTRKHLDYINEKIEKSNLNLSNIEFDVLYLTTLFHDVVYKPWSNTNEEDSITVFEEYWSNHSLIQNNTIRDSVIQNISYTKTHYIWHNIA